MLIIHQINNWQYQYLDYILTFTQVPTNTDVYLKIPAGYHIEDSEGNDISD